jgi:DNA mismatch repair ATPase MutS
MLNAATLTPDSQLQNNTLVNNLQGLLWQHSDFMRLLERLEKDREMVGLVRDLKTTFAALAELYAQLNFLTLMSRFYSIRKPSLGLLSAPSPTTPCPIVCTE